MKILDIGEMGEWYLLSWETGYIQFHTDWLQFLRPKTFNWITFNFVNFNIEWERQLGASLTIEFGLLGMNFRFYNSFSVSEFMKKIEREAKMFENNNPQHPPKK